MTFGLDQTEAPGSLSRQNAMNKTGTSAAKRRLMAISARPLAVITGASSGVGLELARCCVYGGYDAVIAASSPEIHDVALGLRASGAMVEAVQTHLATRAGVDALLEAVGGRQVHALLADAGAQRVIDTDVSGTSYLLHTVGSDMHAARSGRILITGSIAGFVPGTFQAVYNATKALLDSFAFALRAELEDSGVTVTCLMPGATETDFFGIGGMLDTRVGTPHKAAPEDVAKVGFEAMLRGDDEVIAGWGSKLRQAG